MRPSSLRIIGVCLGVCGAPAAAAVPPDAPVRDRYDLSVRSETYVELFRRALLPGPNGALVATDTAVPVHQYMRVRARDVDTGWRADSLDLEVAAWGRSWIGEGDTERTLDADLQVANVGYQHAPFSLRAGRQHAAGGAARYVRFDGLMLRADLGAGFDAEGYGGFTVLPRWDARPGYHHLGSASDSLLREPEALPEPERSGHWLSGGRLGWQSSRAHAGLSFHEQHDDGLSRRTLGVDGRISIVSEASAGAQALFELDALRAQDARLWVDASPLETLDASLEYRHTEPALFLSRQSVLSVFSTDAYDEAGGAAVTRVTDRFSVESAGFVQFYDADRRGARGELAARVLPGAGKRTLVRIEYTRVVVVDNGYHSLRGSLARRIAHDVSGTLEAYAYLYDEAIRGRVTSEVYAGTLSYQVAPDVNVLWGASLAQSPYASFDLQSLVRLEVDLDLSSPRPVP